MLHTCSACSDNVQQCCDCRFTLPFFCLVGDICAFGMDRWLFLTHLLRVFTSTAHSCYGIDGRAVVAGAHALIMF